MNHPIRHSRSLWFAMDLKWRLVAGYSALFALLLLGIALGETTLVRQVLIEDRRAAVPSTANVGAAVLQVSGPGGPITTQAQQVVGNNDLLVATFSSDGSLLTREAGTDVQTVDPRSLLQPHAGAGDAGTQSSYQRSVGGTTYLVQVQTMGRISGSVTAAAPAMPGTLPSLQAGTAAASAPAPAGAPVTVLVAQSLRSVDATVHSLLLVTLAASALGLLAAAAAGLLLAKRALGPLERMTATAQAIAAGGDGALDRRLRVPAYGDEVGRLATTFDQMLDRIQETIAERTRSEDRLRHFAADASHELRTPLAALSGYTEVLLLGGLDDRETAGHALRQMSRELGRMTRLIGDLLMLARLEAGMKVHLQELPVAPLLEGWVEEARLFAERAGRTLEIHAGCFGAGIEDLRVMADPDRLQQILLNLLQNAVKFTRDGGTVAIRAAQRDGAVALEVIDTGPGIGAEELPRLFERFYRSDLARSREGAAEGGGYGLGLAIAQGLAHLQGGTIEVTSTPGKGSTFSVILPDARRLQPPLVHP